MSIITNKEEGWYAGNGENINTVTETSAEDHVLRKGGVLRDIIPFEAEVGDGQPDLLGACVFLGCHHQHYFHDTIMMMATGNLDFYSGSDDDRKRRR